MKFLIRASAILPAIVLSGCWTFNQTEYPTVELSQAKGESEKLVLRVDGFAAVVTEYEMAHGYSTVYVPGWYGRYHYHPGGYETYSTVTAIPYVRETDAFRKRAQNRLEEAGFAVPPGGSAVDYVLEVNFDGPVTPSADRTASVLWAVCTVFFCDYEAEEWSAHLSIRDNRTGRVAFARDYAQRFETHVFGLIPLFSIAACEETTPQHMQSWCLSALTDRIVADATAFLADKGPVQTPAVP